MKSWRTTIFGAGGVLAVLVSALQSLFDGNPQTNPDWNMVVAACLPAIGLLFARDHGVSSEDAGIK